MRPEELYDNLSRIRKEPPRHIWRSIEHMLLKEQSKTNWFDWKLRWILPLGLATLVLATIWVSHYLAYQRELTTYYALVEAFDPWPEEALFD